VKLLLLMAWRNLGRNRRRTIISAAAVAFAVFSMVTMTSMQTGAYNEMIDNAVKIQCGHLQVQAPGYIDDHDINLTVDHLDQVYAATDKIPGVVGAVGRIITGMLVAAGDQSYGSLVIGTDAAREAKASVLARLVRHGEFLDDNDPYGVVIGDKLAKNLFSDRFENANDKETIDKELNALIGMELILLGQAIDGSTAAAKATIRGILHSGQPELDRATVVMNLAPLQERMVMEGRVHHVAIQLQGHEQIPAARAQLEAALAGFDPAVVVLDWKQVEPGLYQGIAMDSASGKIIIFLLLLVVAFGILNTFLMSAFERVREFGVLMAIGCKPRTCAGTLLVESQMLMAVGFTVGLVLGGALSLWLGVHGLTIAGAEELYASYGMSNVIYCDFNAGVAVTTFLEVWIVTFLVALYPAWKITRFRPVEALRHL